MIISQTYHFPDCKCRLMFSTIVLLLMFIFASSYATPISLEVHPREITIGDPVEIHIQLRVQDDTKVELPSTEAFAPAEVIRMDTLKSRHNELSLRYVVSMYETGTADLPDIPIVFITSEMERDTINLSLGQLHVKSVLPDDVVQEMQFELRDVKPPLRLSWTWRDAIPYVIGFLLALAIAAIALYFWKKRKSRDKIKDVYVPPPLPPHIVALTKLQELKDKHLWQNGYVKEYHSELTHILKEYIGGRFYSSHSTVSSRPFDDYGDGVSGTCEMTTEEILDQHKVWAQNNEQLVMVRRILTCADLVKFAKFRPDEVENERSLRSAFDYVNMTKRIEEHIDTGHKQNTADLKAESTSVYSPTSTEVEDKRRDS